MKILAIDTSTAVSSVAIAEPGRLLAEYTLLANNTHSERLMPHIIRLMEETNTVKGDLKAVAVTVGPGSFTGLRIGLTTAKTLAYAWGIPVVGVTTLDSLAGQLAHSSGYVCPMLDAQQKRVYTALYKDGRPLTDYKVAPVAEWLNDLSEQYPQTTFLGEAAAMYQADIIGRAGFCLAPLDLSVPKAGSLAALGLERLAQGQVSDPLTINPLYIRRAAAEELWQQRHNQSC